MSFARGFARGFLKQGLEEKAARDQAHAEMVKELGAEFRQASKLFRQEEKNIQNRFNNIRSEKGLPMALYASYEGLTKTDYGMELALKASKNFVDSIAVVGCSENLINKETNKIVNTFFGSYKVYESRCPLIGTLRYKKIDVEE